MLPCNLLCNWPYIKRSHRYHRVLHSWLPRLVAPVIPPEVRPSACHAYAYSKRVHLAWPCRNQRFWDRKRLTFEYIWLSWQFDCFADFHPCYPVRDTRPPGLWGEIPKVGPGSGRVVPSDLPDLRRWFVTTIGKFTKLPHLQFLLICNPECSHAHCFARTSRLVLRELRPSHVTWALDTDVGLLLDQMHLVQ